MWALRRRSVLQSRYMPPDKAGSPAKRPAVPKLEVMLLEQNLLQIIEIGGEGCNLCLGQGVRNWLHDSRCIRFFPILTALVAPVEQFTLDVLIELACQTGERSVPFRFWTVTGSTWRNIGIGNALFIDLLPPGHEFLWRAPDGFGIEIPEMLGNSLLHCRTQVMSYVFHHRMQPPVLNEGSQLILEIFDLLPRETRYGGSCPDTLPRRLVAALAILDLGLKVLRRKGGRGVFRVAGRGKSNCQDCRLQRQLQAVSN